MIMWMQLKKWAEEEARKNMIKIAEKFVMYHGTTSEYLPGILSQGFLMKPPRKVWEESAESLPGTYFTDSMDTAISASDSARDAFGGNRVIVAVQIESRSPEAALDEDLMPFMSKCKIKVEGRGLLERNSGFVDMLVDSWLDCLKIKKEARSSELMALAKKVVLANMDLSLVYELEYLIDIVSWVGFRGGPDILDRNNKQINLPWGITFTGTDMNDALEKFYEYASNRLRWAKEEFLMKAKSLVVRDSQGRFNVRLKRDIGFRGANKILGVIEVKEELNKYKVKVRYAQDKQVVRNLINEYAKNVSSYFVGMER